MGGAKLGESDIIGLGGSIFVGKVSWCVRWWRADHSSIIVSFWDGVGNLVLRRVSLDVCLSLLAGNGSCRESVRLHCELEIGIDCAGRSATSISISPRGKVGYANAVEMSHNSGMCGPMHTRTRQICQR